MGMLDRVLEGNRAVLLLGEKVELLSAEVKSLAAEVRELDRRLIRVETALELASRGAFGAAPPVLGDERKP